MTGLFITMEGGDGSGKSLQAKLLYDYLKEKDLEVILTREPGGTSISEKVREIIIDKENKEMSAMTEALLYASSRAQIVSELIRPALLEDKVVICDRFLDSSIVYQGVARELGFETVEIINSYATGGLKPDITFLFDIDPKSALNRKDGLSSLDRLESENIEFHNKVHKGYKELAKKYSDRITVIDANLSPQEIFETVKNKIDSILF